MKSKPTILLAITGILYFPFAAVNAADQEQKQETKQFQQKEQQMMYGWQLMTVKERDEHRKKMRSLNTEEERTAYRQEHHKLMQQRAKERGVAIPDEPPERGSGRGFGGGRGDGSGGANK